MKRLLLPALFAIALAFPASAPAHPDSAGRAAATVPPRQVSLTLKGSGRGTWNGSDVYFSPLDSSRLAVAKSGQISYSWSSVKTLDFKIPADPQKPFDVTTSGDLTGNWQSSESGTKVDDSNYSVVSYSCTDNHVDVPTPVNAELIYRPGDAQVLLSLYPDAFFFPGVPGSEFGCPAELDTYASGGIVPQNLFQSDDAKTDILLPATVITVPKRVTANFPNEHIDTKSGDSSVHVVNDGTVDVNPCGGFGDATVTFLQGDASAGGDALGVGSSVNSGTTVTTNSRTRMELRLPDKSVLRIGPQSKVEMNCIIFGKSAEDRKVSAKLVVGDIWARFAHAVGGDAKFEVQTENAVNGVRGTIFETTYNSTKKATHVHAIVDTVRSYNVASPSRVVLVHAGHCSDIVGKAPPKKPYRC